MRRADFDCVILLQAARATGPAGACLRAVRDGRPELVASPEVRAEGRGVLTGPKTLHKFPVLTLEAVNAFLEDVATLAVTLSDVPKVFTLARDPKDEPDIDLALAAKARYLVSRDKDPLDLMGDESFRRQYPDLAMIDPVTLLKELATRAEQSPEPKTGKGEGQG